MLPLRWLVIGLALCSGGAAVGQSPAKEDKAKAANEVEVKFREGSTLRMSVLQDSIDVVTKFGKLNVPMSEVRLIDFGVHAAEGVPQKIDSAMKKLASPSFKEREEGLTELVKLGPAAYPALHTGTKSSDLEVSQRTQTAIKQLKAKYAPELLRLNLDDRIVTNDFTIVGRIVTPIVRAETPLFGALDLKLPELRTMLWINGNTDVEVHVDAAKYCSRTAWMDSGVTLEPGSGLQIQAAGEVDLLPGNGAEFISGPQGNFNVGGGPRLGPNRVPGVLLGKIGDNGTPFVIGERYNGSQIQEGRLFLQIIPGNFGANQPAQGAYKVKINAGLHLR